MKYCTKCGNQLTENQRFCNRCGQPVAGRMVAYNEPKKRSAWPWIFGILGVLILLAGLIFAGLQIYHNMGSNQGAQSLQQAQDGSDTPATALITGPNEQQRAERLTTIDVLSDSFSANFMNEPHVGGYNGVDVGMTRHQVELSTGQSTGTVQLRDKRLIRYNNIGVLYGADNKVISVYVTPDNVTTQAFTNFHGDPKIGGASPMLYDNNPNNGFSIYVHTRNGYVVAVENGPQY
ncbi:zinc-ribbon domain-containing protein [Staphylococcus sp. IVB6214]|uniref:zinc-ribbon domain-containing protein n=1 Tax=Staphylococcus sp. IVB6214 TaxID=2989766 RepID=UPI0021D08B4F|nr:zinc-ribbon domain-containing protein [Staphylococcus sp. IVB6214]UXR82615.1 zinc-ribbon domain-containing protein [Staphylococcus sp. IVB6214]